MNSPSRSSRQQLSARQRGQSEVVGIVLIIAVMLIGSLAVVTLGATAVDDTDEQLSEDRARKALTQFDSKAGLVALGEADSQRVSFPTDNSEQFGVVQGDAWMNVTFENQTTDYQEEVVNVSLGSVVYDGGGTQMAYQGGGVFRKTDQGGSMIAPPEFHFRNGTLTLPTVNISGDSRLGTTAVITQNGVETHFPVETSANKTNPLENHLVTVTVKSDYYRGWGEYFVERTDGEVDYDHDNNIVELTLVSPLQVKTLTSATSSLAPDGAFTVSGNAASTCASDVYVDSYNSSGTDKDYCEQFNDGETGDKGDLIYGGDVTIDSGAGNSDFHGEIESGGTVTVQTGGNGAPYIYGNISYTDSCNPSVGDCEDRIKSPGEEVRQISGLDTLAPLNWHVNSTVEQVRAENDNATTGNISGAQLDFGGDSTITLDPGDYYLDRLVLQDSEELKLNTTNGTVRIAVSEDVVLFGDGSSGGVINVTGDHHAKLYVEGDGITGDHFEMERNSKVLTENDNGTMFRTYGTEDFNATIGDSSGTSNLAKYVGILYAPPGASGAGRIDVTGGEIFGGLLTGTTTIDRGAIHYDERLANGQVISSGAKVIKVTYLHVTVNRIQIESG